MSNYDDLVKQKTNYDNANNQADSDFSKYILYSCGGGIIVLIPYILSGAKFGNVAEKLIAWLLIIGTTHILKKYVFMKSADRYSLNCNKAIENMDGDDYADNHKEILLKNNWVKLSNWIEYVMVAEIIVFLIFAICLIFI